MRFTVATSGRFVLAILVFVLAMPELSAGQTRARTRGAGDDTGGGRAVPRTEARTPAPAPDREPAKAAAPAPAPAASEPRPVPRRTPSAEAAGTQTTARTTGARPREGRPTVGTAVPRGSVPRPPRNETPVVAPVYYGSYGSYWPWGFGGLGYGSYYGSYYGGFYRSVLAVLQDYGYPYGGYG